MSLQLDTPIQFVKGVGPRRAQLLAGLGVVTLEDLLTYFPRRFDLRRQAQTIESLRIDEDLPVTIAGTVCEVEYHAFGSKPYLACTLDDGTGWMVLKWFHGGYLRGRIVPGLVIAAMGKITLFQETRQIINPNFQVLSEHADANLDQDELLPVYPAIADLPSGVIASVIKGLLPETQRLLPRWFDEEFIQARQLMPRPQAIAAMHRPEDKDAWAQARHTLAYEELLLMQLGIALQRMKAVSRPAFPLSVSPEIDKRIRARFPFALTAAQDRTIVEIAADLARPRPMNRLLQGDVGSGKTVVALYAALAAVAHHKQAAIMAPTEILARQHYEKVTAYLAGSRVRVALLVGGQRPDEREQIITALAAGEIDIVVGTHALLTPQVQFAHLGLVVVDEQHKFGVEQRTGFRAKGHAPHCLVMTATPIPRTLAMTLFGDLDISVIDQLPPGRGRTETICLTFAQMKDVIDKVRGRLFLNQQAYFVYPLVNDSDNVALSAAETSARDLAARAFPQYKVGLIHGQMPRARQQEVMRQFANGSIHILAASTVVEVGLDVPNANAMVVMNAERFGLAQLHQLRGRIGRGRDDAVCILVAGAKNPLALERLKVLTETSDGFKIAEADLRLRGPGEFFGTRQHGLPELKVADLSEDFELLRTARRDAFAMVNEDPDLSQPAHLPLRAAVMKTYGQRLGLIAGV